MDGGNVRAHRSTTGASKKISPNEPKNHDLGYSRGGYGTKIHLVCDANGNYMNAVLSAGQEYETQHFEAVVSSISVLSHRAPSKRRLAEFVVTKTTPLKPFAKSPVYTT